MVTNAAMQAVGLAMQAHWLCTFDVANAIVGATYGRLRDVKLIAQTCPEE